MSALIVPSGFTAAARACQYSWRSRSAGVIFATAAASAFAEASSSFFSAPSTSFRARDTWRIVIAR